MAQVRRPNAARPWRPGLFVLFWSGLVLGSPSLTLAASPASVFRSAPESVEGQSPSDWALEKCSRYKVAAEEALQRYGQDGLSQEFLEAHQAFLDRNCLDPRDVCPRSQAELGFANRMVIRSMNAGTASTFPPFACMG